MTYLLLHGGGGPATMQGLATRLSERTHAPVLLPTHPGFGGTPRPGNLRTVKDLAGFYVDLLDTRELADVTVVGNSFGGWLAAEIGLMNSPRVVELVLVDAIGAELEGHPAADVKAMTPAELAAHSWHDPGKAPGRAPDENDLQTLAAYAGPTMSDPTLLDRLRDLHLPAHVIWGESDRIVDTAHAKALAAAIPGSRLTILPASGHLPQLETPEALLDAL